MNRFERANYFRYQKKLQEAGKCIKKPYDAGKHYYKGKHKGELRDVFEIDGEIFNQLWKKISPYAFVSVHNSRLARDYQDKECIVSEIKFLTLRVLRYFGGVPRGRKFSYVFRTIVNNVLTNISQQRFNRDGIKTLYHAESIYTPVGGGDDGEEVTIEQKLGCSDFVDKIHFYIDIPTDLRTYVSDLLKGIPVEEVAKHHGMKRAKDIAKFHSMLCKRLGPVLGKPELSMKGAKNV
jgi:hypothetical protein